MDFQTLYHLVVNMAVFKISLATYAINLSLYYFFARNIKKQLSFPWSINKHAIFNKVVELKDEGDKQARISYFFYQVAMVNLSISFAIGALLRFVEV